VTRPRYPSDLTRAARRHARRVRAREEARQRGERAQALLDYAGRVRSLATAAPDDETRARLHKLAYKLELNAVTTAADRERLVLRALARWAALTLAEIAEETSLGKADVKRALAGLQSAGRVVSFTRGERRGERRGVRVRTYRLNHSDTPSRTLNPQT
jgi:predicted transcriptional regulator